MITVYLTSPWYTKEVAEFYGERPKKCKLIKAIKKLLYKPTPITYSLESVEYNYFTDVTTYTYSR